jgi:heme exporter protein D
VTTGSDRGDLLWSLAVGATILVAVVLNVVRLRSVLRDRRGDRGRDARRDEGEVRDDRDPGGAGPEA